MTYGVILPENVASASLLGEWRGILVHRCHSFTPLHLVLMSST